MIAKKLTILDDFPPVGYEVWKAQVLLELKGVPFETKMITHTYDGVNIQPIYTAESWPSANDPSGFPGSAPYTRGTKPLGHSQGGWDVRQEASNPEPAAANAVIRGELKQGVTSIELKLDAAASAGLDADDPRSAGLCGCDGVMVYSLGDLGEVLADVPMDVTPVSLEAGAAFLPAAALLAALWEEAGRDPPKALGAFNADPLGCLMRDGALPVPLEVALEHMTDLAAWTAAHHPNVTSVRVSTAVYHHAGSGSVQDLAFALGTAVAYLRAMTAAGLELDAALKQIAFHETVGCKFFQATAKLRALRKLWARTIEACGADVKTASNLRVVVETSRRVLTHRDPWINLLRNTAASFAGAIGGADAIITLPMDAALGSSDEVTRRLARNTQVILQEECHLGAVVDPGGGSWFLETLTDEMAEKAWSLFQQVEAQGGMIQAATSGWVRDQIRAVEELRERDIATRKAGITGISEHPDVFAKEIRRSPLDHAGLRAVAAESLMQWRRDRAPAAALRNVQVRQRPGSGTLMAAAVEAARAGATIGEITSALAGAAGGCEAARTKPMAVAPYAAAYEQLRDTVDAYARTHGGDRPKVFFANLGAPGDFLARSTYAQDFFEAGGFIPLNNDGFSDPQTVAAAFAASGAAIAVICSTDARYATDLEHVAPRLRAAGARTVVLAGNPGSSEARFRAAGVNEFIFIRCNALEILRSLLHEAGVR
jgi:methylmalonyl-CoA mutase